MTYLSPLRYPGGKASLVKYLVKIIEANQPIDTYIEPYAGGAGAALELLHNGRVERIILNDSDKFIYKFWHVVLNDTEHLIRRIKKTRVNIKEWKKQRALLSDYKNASDLEIGFAAFFLNRCNRSGILRAEVGPIGGIKQLSKWKIDARFNKDGLIARIKNIASFKDKIQFYNFDAIDFLKNRLSKLKIDKRKTLVYLDPPYYKRGPELYRTFYAEQDHRGLQKFLKNELNIRWVLSYDDVKFINSLYKGENINGLRLNHFANRAKVGRELIITSDNCIAPSIYKITKH